MKVRGKKQAKEGRKGEKEGREERRRRREGDTKLDRNAIKIGPWRRSSGNITSRSKTIK